MSGGVRVALTNDPQQGRSVARNWSIGGLVGRMECAQAVWPGGGGPEWADLIVIAKEPRPGRVKTRLTPAYTPHQAAELAAAALADTLDAVLATPATRRVLALEGSPGAWLPGGFEVVAQDGQGLDQRLAHAFATAYRCRPMVLIGMDTPQVTPELLSLAGMALLRHDAVFGPASDGGYWLLGLREPNASLLHGVPMSHPDTGREQLARLHASGLDVAVLPELTDVDTAQDVRAVAAQVPDGRFARAVRAMAVVADAR